MEPTPASAAPAVPPPNGVTPSPAEVARDAARRHDGTSSPPEPPRRGPGRPPGSPNRRPHRPAAGAPEPLTAGHLAELLADVEAGTPVWQLDEDGNLVPIYYVEINRINGLVEKLVLR